MSARLEEQVHQAQGTSAASRVARAIRDKIVDGSLLPAVRLPEEAMRAELGVSRSTLREGFQMLIQDRLLVHRLSRGFFVRELSRAEIVDLFTVRRSIECAALLEVKSLQPAHLRALSQAVADGEAAAGQGDWQRVAACNIRFHESIVALAGSPRLNILVHQILAEYRLSYAHMNDPSAFHAPFLKRNVAVAEQVRSGDLEGASAALRDYLLDSEKALLVHYQD